jgi:hypothetical protein
VPAENTVSPGSNDLRNASAIWLLHELPVHKINIRLSIKNTGVMKQGFAY